jgi:hypothetical protein
MQSKTDLKVICKFFVQCLEEIFSISFGISLLNQLSLSRISMSQDGDNQPLVCSPSCKRCWSRSASSKYSNMEANAPTYHHYHWKNTSKVQTKRSYFIFRSGKILLPRTRKDIAKEDQPTSRSSPLMHIIWIFNTQIQTPF